MCTSKRLRNRSSQQAAFTKPPTGIERAVNGTGIQITRPLSSNWLNHRTQIYSALTRTSLGVSQRHGK